MVQLHENMTLGEWLPFWMKFYKKGTIKGTSFHQLELLARLIPDELMCKPVSDILPMELQFFYNQFGLTASKSYMDKMRVMVNAAFAAAVENGLCDRNPTLRLKTPRIAEKPRESYSLEQVTQIIDYAMCCENSRISVAVLLLLLTGLRRGELLGLKWSDIDGDLLRVNRSVFIEDGKPVVVEGQAKTVASIRVIPLMPELLYRIRSLPRNSEFVFGTKNGTIWHPRNFSRDYNRFFEQLREVYPEIQRLSPHCCRHTFGTLVLFSGSDIRTVQMLLGHTDIKTTSRYTHPDLGNMQRAVSGLRSELTVGK